MSWGDICERRRWIALVCLLSLVMQAASAAECHLAEDAGDVGSARGHLDEITSLPGLDKQPSFRHYAGYLSASPTKQLFYWFVESTREADKDPLLLWLNGGPGCSSLGGLLTGHGPYVVNADGKTLRDNQYSWNKVANMLYLESPAGVGFSYAEDDQYATDDDKVADDNHMALRDFFRKFPRFLGRAFYVTGESYAGVYIPTLMQRLARDPCFNMKGAAMGNAILPAFKDFTSSNIYFWYYHGIIDTATFEKVTDACCSPEEKHNNCRFLPPRDTRCASAMVAVLLRTLTLNLNRYNVHSECTAHTDAEETHKMAEQMFVVVLQQLSGKLESADIERLVEARQKQRHLPCVNETAITDYLRIPEVQMALHVRQHTGLAPWSQCSSLIGGATDTYTSIYQSPGTASIVTELLRDPDHSYRFLIYNGDLDTVCPYWADRQAVVDIAQTAQLKARSPYQPWFYATVDGSKQVGGFSQQFERLVFKTGSGHMVPTDKPLPAFSMIKEWLAKNDNAQISGDV